MYLVISYSLVLHVMQCEEQLQETTCISITLTMFPLPHFFHTVKAVSVSIIFKLMNSCQLLSVGHTHYVRPKEWCHTCNRQTLFTYVGQTPASVGLTNLPQSNSLTTYVRTEYSKLMQMFMYYYDGSNFVLVCKFHSMRVATCPFTKDLAVCQRTVCTTNNKLSDHGFTELHNLVSAVCGLVY